MAISVLSVGNWSYRLEMDGYAIQAIRLDDDIDRWRREFKVMIQAPSA